MAGLHFDITGDNSNFLRKLDEARNGIHSTSKQIEESGMSIEQIFGRLTKGVAAFGAGITAKEIVSNIVRVRGEFQQLEVAFNTMLGSEQKAGSLMQQLVKTAATTPFDLQSVANGAKQLLAYGTSVKDVNGTLVRLGDIAAGLSIPLGDLVYLYGTTMSQGRLYTQDLNQFAGRGIPMIGELAKQFGVAESEVKKLVESGKVGFPEVQKVIESLTNEGGKFGGLMEAQSKTITGKISNIEDSIFTMYNNLGKQSEGVINDALSGVSYLVENYEQVGKTVLELAATYGAYKAILMSIAAYQSVATGITYSVEIAELSKLIPLKQQSANEDVIAAVASGKLTQSKAEQVIALRAEVNAKLQSLQATAAQTAAENASAMSVYKSATQRMLVAKQNMALAQSQMQIAINSGTAEEIAVAKKNAQTASLELNNAAITKNNTHKTLNIAATNKKAAVDAVSSFQIGANTTSQVANTTSTNLLTVAKTRLAVASKALGLSMLSNPYVLATAAIVGLGYSIYKLITYQTDSEKAQAKLNDTVKEFHNQTASENAEINRLFDKLRNTSKETSNYQKTKDEIIKKYGSYLEGLNQEISTLNNVEAAYRAISTAAKQAAADRAITKATQEAQDDWAENRGNVIDKLKNTLTSGGKMTDGAAEAFIETINRELKETGKLSDETTKKIEKYNYTITHPETGEVIGSGNSVLWAVDALKKNDKVLDDLYSQMNSKFGVNTNEYENLGKADIDAYIKGFENALSNFKKTGNKQTIQLKTGWVSFESEEEINLQLNKLNEVKKSLNENLSLNSEKKAASKWLSSYKKAYDDAEKAYNDFLKSKKVMSDADRDKELERLKGLRDTAKATYERKGGSVSSDNKQDKAADTLRQQQEKLALLMDKQALDQSRSAEDLQTQVDQARINAMREGSVRTLEQMKLDHSKEMQQLGRQQEDLLRKKIEEERAKFDAKEDEKAATTKDYKKQTFDGSKIALSPSESYSFGQQRMYLDIKQMGETQALLDKERQAWNDYLTEYGTFQEKKEAITAEYDEKIANASTKGEKESLKKELENRIKEVNLDELKSSINFADIFGNLDAQSTETLTTMRDKLKEVIEKSAKDLKPTDLKALQDAFKDIDLKLADRNPFGELKQGIDDYKASTQAVIKAQEDLNTLQQGGEVIAGTYLDATGKICTKLLTQAQAEKNLSEAQRSKLEAQSKLTKSVNSIGQQGQQIVQAGNDLTNMLTDLGVSIPDSVKGALDGVGQVMDSMANIDLMKPMSIITGITGALAGIGKIIGSIFTGKDNNAQRQSDLLAELDRMSEYWDDILGKKKEYISMSGTTSSKESIQAAKDYLNVLKKQEEMYKEIGRMTLNITNGSHSINQRMWDGSYKYNGRNWKDVSGEISQAIGVSFNGMSDMLNMSSDQLQWIKENYGGFWLSMDDTFRAQLENLIGIKDKGKEAIDTLNEALTGISFDSLKGNYLSSLQDMDSSTDDFVDDFNQKLLNGLLNQGMQDKFSKDIEALYGKWGGMMEDLSNGDISEEEAAKIADQLKKDNETLANGMINYRQHLFDLYGLDSSDSDREASKKGFASMSQDSADELNGRFTVIQGHTYEINGSVKAIQSDTAKIAEKLSFLTNMDKNMSDMVRGNDVIISHLSNIEGYTENLVDIRQFMYSMKLGIDTLNTKGITLKR